jgi:hypothetical protein
MEKTSPLDLLAISEEVDKGSSQIGVSDIDILSLRIAYGDGSV